MMRPMASDTVNAKPLFSVKQVRTPEEIWALADALDEMDASPEQANQIIDALVVDGESEGDSGGLP